MAATPKTTHTTATIVTPSELVDNIDLVAKTKWAALAAKEKATKTFTKSYKKGRSLFIWGAPGIGKSSILQQYCDRHGMSLFDLRLSQKLPEDVRGIPFRVRVHNQDRMVYANPADLPLNVDFIESTLIEDTGTTITFENPRGFRYRSGRDADGMPIFADMPKVTASPTNKAYRAEITDVTLTSFTVKLFDKDNNPVEGYANWSVLAHAYGILALEEFNSAALSVQTASYELVLEGRLGSYVVPEDVFIVALGNRETDRGLTFAQPLPIANRFMHLELTDNGHQLFPDWFDWAVQANQHPFVVSFLERNKASLISFNPKTVSRGFPTPRSWEAVSDVLYAANSNLNRARSLINGAIGEGVASSFMTHCALSEHLPKPENIMSGAVTHLPESSIAAGGVSLSYMIAVTLCYEMRYRLERLDTYEGAERAKHKAALDKEINNVIDFMMNNFQEEIIVMAIKIAVKNYQIPFTSTDHPSFREFIGRYKKYFLSNVQTS